MSEEMEALMQRLECRHVIESTPEVHDEKLEVYARAGWARCGQEIRVADESGAVQHVISVLVRLAPREAPREVKSDEYVPGPGALE